MPLLNKSSGNTSGAPFGFSGALTSAKEAELVCRNIQKVPMKLGGFMALSGVHRLGEYQECHSDSDRGEMEEEEAGEMEEEEAGKVEGNDCVDHGHDGINSRQILNTPTIILPTGPWI